MKKYTIDFIGVKTYYHFYESILKGLETPDWCGDNLDAVWDMLTGYIEIPEIIYVRGGKSLPIDLQNKYNSLLKVLIRASTYYEDEKFIVEEID